MIKTGQINRIPLIFFMILLTGISSARLYGQDIDISGRITDSVTEEPLPGAHILINDTRFGAISDYDGRFLIREIPAGKYRVTISYIGYEPQDLQVDYTSKEQEGLIIKLVPKLYLAEPAIITANRTEVARNMTPLTVSQVNRKTLEESGESNLLPVVARNVPGVFLTERGMTGFGVADGAAGQISIRGIGGSPNTRVLVMVDGHPQYMGIFGHPLPDAYLSSDAEKVEVIRGPASVLYGSNAMAGVINIITRQQSQDGISLMANAGYGSFNTMKFNGSAGYRNKKFQAYVSYNHDQTDGHRDNSEFKIDNGYLKLSYDLNSHFRIWTDASMAWYSSTNPGPVDTQDTTFIDPTHYQDIFRGFASVALENKYEKSSGTAKFYYNWGEHDLWDGFASTDKNMGLMLYQSFELFKGSTVTVGYDFASYGGIAENTIPEVPVQIVDTSVYETGVYLLAQQRFFGRLNLTAGIRYQYHELFGSVWVPQAGATYDISEKSTVRANVSKGYRSPSIMELFMFKPANPDLDPENVWNYEAGMTQKFLKNRLSFDLTGFFASGSNLIEVQGVFPDVQYRNTGEFEHYGIEFQGRYMIAEGLDAAASYSWLHTDKPVLAAPEHMVYAEGNYRVKGFTFRLSGQYISQLITRTDPQAEESYFNLSARAGYTYKNFLTFYLEGNNLLDEDYEINYGYPMPGINFFGGITVKWVGGK